MLSLPFQVAEDEAKHFSLLSKRLEVSRCQRSIEAAVRIAVIQK